ncbi:MAG TPA: hypothetical protein VMZ53_01595 [Kofleriaceae bacterium]|nr:hypothetical protein [Kofleriaceae bacterium]
MAEDAEGEASLGYRAIGRAAREARESGEGELQDDIRIVMNVLRSHAKAPKRKKR